MGSFIYDNTDFQDIQTSAISPGYISSDTFTSVADWSDYERVNDGFDDSYAESTSLTYLGLRFDLGSSKEHNCFAVYFDLTQTFTAKIFTSDNSSSSWTQRAAVNERPFDWYIFDYDSDVTARYICFHFQPLTSGNRQVKMYEGFAGKKYTFDHKPDLSTKESSSFGTDIITSTGGVNHLFKQHSKQKTWNLSWSNIGSTMKTELESLQSSVSTMRSFIYDDGTTRNWVRLSKPINFTEISYGRYQTSVQLIESVA